METALQILYLEPLGAGLILLAISAAYFVAGSHQPTGRRVLKSSHGLLFLCAMYPVVATRFTASTHTGWLGYPFWVFVWLGIAATAYSFKGYARNGAIHLLHVFTILYGALAMLYGMNCL